MTATRCSWPAPTSSPHDEERWARALAPQVDGLLLVSPLMPESALLRAGRPGAPVLVNREIDGIPAVLTDATEATGHAVEHLHALGHRAIIYLAGPDGYSNSMRLRGYRATCERLGVEPVELGPFQARFSAGVRAADLVLASAATAVVAYNDEVAVGVINRLADRGVRVPDDLSIIGFDDTSLAEMVTPRLTTVRLPVAMAGQAAARRLLDLRTPARPTPGPLTLPGELIVRSSTGPHRPLAGHASRAMSDPVIRSQRGRCRLQRASSPSHEAADRHAHPARAAVGGISRHQRPGPRARGVAHDHPAGPARAGGGRAGADGARRSHPHPGVAAPGALSGPAPDAARRRRGAGSPWPAAPHHDRRGGHDRPRRRAHRLRGGPGAARRLPRLGDHALDAGAAPAGRAAVGSRGGAPGGELLAERHAFVGPAPRPRSTSCGRARSSSHPPRSTRTALRLSPAEASVQRHLVEIAERVVLVATYEVYASSAPARIAPLDRLTGLINDRPPPRASRRPCAGRRRHADIASARMSRSVVAQWQTAQVEGGSCLLQIVFE